MNPYALYQFLVRLGRLKWLWWSLALLVAFGFLGYKGHQFVEREFRVAEELPFYDVGPRPDDDTLRVAVIGDSWAEWHMTLNLDTLFQQYGARLTDKPIKCMTRGRGGAKTKDVYFYMFRSLTQEYPWMHDLCTQPLLEEHPDYCVVMVGINDAWKKRSVSYYTGNYRLIIRLLLANRIRPVVMEIPDFDLEGWLGIHRKRDVFFYRIYAYFNDVVEDDVTPFREGLKEMLRDTGLADSVLFIPADRWIPQDNHFSEDIYQEDHVHLNYYGYHVLDSCIVSEIINDYDRGTSIMQ